MNLNLVLLIILVLLLVGALPLWPYNRGYGTPVTGGWGYGPSGILGVILLVLVIYLLMSHV